MGKYIVSIEKYGPNLEENVFNSLRKIGLLNVIRSGCKVAIKPNFTYPYYKEGVTTSPDLIESLISVLKEYLNDIFIVESDGGYYSWRAEDAFKGHSIDIIVKKYGIRAMNLSKVDKIYLTVTSNGTKYQMPFPRFLKEEVDFFITMPVPKVHCMTGVSLAMKNQWGCIPDTMRLSFHHIFNETILELNRNLPQTFVVGDGRFFLDGNGPMYGNKIKKDLIIASNSIGSFEVVLCEMMGINIDRIPHLNFAKNNGFLPHGIEDVELNTQLSDFKYKSILNRSLQNKIMYICFKSKFLTYLLYISNFGKTLHKIFYKIRRTSDHLKNIEQDL